MVKNARDFGKIIITKNYHIKLAVMTKIANESIQECRDKNGFSDKICCKNRDFDRKCPSFFSVGKKMSFLGNYFRKTYCKIKEDVVYYCVRIFWMPNEYR